MVITEDTTRDDLAESMRHLSETLRRVKDRQVIAEIRAELDAMLDAWPERD